METESDAYTGGSEVSRGLAIFGASDGCRSSAVSISSQRAENRHMLATSRTGQGIVRRFGGLGEIEGSHTVRDKL